MTERNPAGFRPGSGRGGWFDRTDEGGSAGTEPTQHGDPHLSPGASVGLMDPLNGGGRGLEDGGRDLGVGGPFEPPSATALHAPPSEGDLDDALQLVLESPVQGLVSPPHSDRTLLTGGSGGSGGRVAMLTTMAPPLPFLNG
eukprot:CAMPEP_0113588646 /NCGR_PEP_ID=MMETSP0015_2-20120614/35631_1 /TAXON_ID=2838 /ORGANISM="Odontella" /LENGTH=141 /DNA_ID=CAMNT_0000494543 /DNA_START=257 /DNA_END=678 /DNA_ORIENTATION=- /assembly_acc=CAM_ASM_000160